MPCSGGTKQRFDMKLSNVTNVHSVGKIVGEGARVRSRILDVIPQIRHSIARV